MPELDGNSWAARSLRRWRMGAALSCTAMLAVLAFAPTKEYLRAWRRVQRHYNELAAKRNLPTIDVHVRQTWIPSAQRADRCGTCHLGAAGAAPLPTPAVFAAHPAIPHNIEEYGCTYCHSGQGLATEQNDAHGSAGTWGSPILPARYLEAGCGSCHSGVKVPLPEQVDGAPDALADFRCEKCHRAGGTAASLSGIALRGVPEDWLDRHRGMPLPEDDAKPLSEMDEDQRAAAESWLSAKIGAPHLARGKELFFGLGCLGCHRRGALGGDVGPELTNIGVKDVQDLVPEGESGPATLPRWLRQHFLTPQQVVAGSRMPPVDRERLTADGDLDDLVTFVLSLRGEPVPDELTPPDRASVTHGLGRDFPTTGRGLFVTFCSGCHGLDGQGVELKTLGLVSPMIGTRGFLAAVTPRFLRASIERGRRARFMPAFGKNDAGLSRVEIATLVTWLGKQGFEATPYAAPTAPPDAKNGEKVFAERCAACHGAGPAPRLGRDLQAPGAMDELPDQDFWGVLQSGWLEMGMPAFPFLEPGEIHDLLAYLRGGRAAPTLPAVAADLPHAYLGRAIWGAKCQACHGRMGEGGDGPLLDSTPYLAWASDSYLAQRITHHQGSGARDAIGTPSPSDLAAILGTMRSWPGEVDPALPAAPSPEAVTRGQKVFASHCAECHGADAAGKTAPAIGSKDFQSLVSRPFVVMTILEGRKGTPMVAWRDAGDKALSVADAFDVADFLRSGAPAATATAPAGSGPRRAP